MFRKITTSFLLTIFAGAVYAHGNVVPSAVDVEGLPPLEEWGTENPYRDIDGEVRDKIIATGKKGYGQNCVNCHGLEAVSGGIAPDLRMLEPGFDDQYYITIVREGGKGMPAWEEMLEPESAWAIKTWLETKYEDAMAEKYGN